MSDPPLDFRQNLDGWSVQVPGVLTSAWELMLVGLPFLGVGLMCLIIAVRMVLEGSVGSVTGGLLALLCAGFGLICTSAPLYACWLFLQTTWIEVVQDSLRVERRWFGVRVKRVELPLEDCAVSYGSSVLQIGPERIQVDDQPGLDELVKRIAHGARAARAASVPAPPVPAELAALVRA